MRIIAGDMKGRALHVPRRASFRPTTDRVKEALFNTLNGMLAWKGCRVCDLFAGSGNLGLEALSRGARSALFVEQNRQHRSVLQRNIENLGVEDRAQVLPLRAEHYWKTDSAGFELIFADPPYDYENYGALLSGCARHLLPEGILSVEHAVRTQLPDMRQLFKLDRREYGITAVTLFRSLAGVDAS